MTTNLDGVGQRLAHLVYVATEAAQFLDLYNRLYQSLYTVAQEAAWKSSTDVSPEHTGQRIGAARRLRPHGSARRGLTRVRCHERACLCARPRRADRGPEGTGRQETSAEQLRIYGRVCGWTLARARTRE